MDAVTHAFSAALLMIATGNEAGIAFCALGAVIPDIDFLFRRWSDRHPSLFIFVHGGITHSLVGAAMISVMAGLALLSVSWAGFLRSGVPATAVTGFIILGAWLHVALDFLASPGIPVLYPLTERKFSASIFAGPSLVLMAASLVFLAAIVVAGAPTTAMWAAYGAFFAAFVGLSAAVRLLAGVRSNTSMKADANTIVTCIPTIHPFRWIVVGDGGNTWTVGMADLADLADGVISTRTYRKYTGISPEEAGRLKAVPEVRRLYYHSYLVTAEATEDGVVFRDPLREEGVVWYPPFYKRVVAGHGGRTAIKDSVSPA